ncbi:MAG: aromatic ring-hydroxylating oxygenase subunit alpha [Dongiaceae bacterium]
MDDLAQLLEQLAENAGRTFAAARTLPPGVYASPEFRRLEVERIFHREWLCVGRIDDLPNPGDYVTTAIPDLPIVTVRTDTGDIVSFSNICRHRLMRLLDGRGNRPRGIVCPYHAWTYDLNGQLIGAPHMERTQGFDRRQIRLPRLRTEIWQGWVYVSLDPEIAPIDRHLRELHDITDRYQAGGYVKLYHDEFEWRTNWKCLIENFMEDYHLPVVHRATISSYSPTSEVEVFEGRETFSYHLNRKTPDAPRGLAHPNNTSLAGDWRRTTILYAVLPGHLVNLGPDHSWYLSLFPIDTDRVRVRFGLSYAPEVLAEVDDRAAFTAKWREFFDTLNAEDRSVVEGVRANAGARLAAPGPLSDLERFSYDFGRYLHRMLSAR